MSKKEALLVASTETGLGVNAEKSKYTVMPRGQNAEQNLKHKKQIICPLKSRCNSNLAEQP
jgi:hypothetical protein